MYVDALCLLSDAQAVTADAASTNTFDSARAADDVFAGEPMAVAFEIDVAADSTTGDETYEFQVIQSAAANLGSPDILAQRTIAAASLSAGSVHYLVVPPGAKSKRYLGAYYNVGGTTPTVTVTAHLIPLSMVQNYKAYAKNYTIS